MLVKLRAYRQARKEIERLNKELAEKEELLRRQRRDPRRSSREPFDASKMVWMFGTGRSGSTWLSSMLGDVDGCRVWQEPMVGELFGNLYYVRGSERQRESHHFVLGKHREAWLRSIRNFVLDGAAARFPAFGEGSYLVVKEPNGSIGAPLLVEALPESRMILLIRDPRDVVASTLDASKEGGWRQQAVARKNQSTGVQDLDAFARTWANVYLSHAGNAAKAYEQHGGSKALIRYEDLRADTLGTMRRMCSELGIPADEAELARVIEKHSWENIPAERRGKGKFYRKATPGGWREDLTPGQAEIVEGITAPLLKRFYPE